MLRGEEQKSVRGEQDICLSREKRNFCQAFVVRKRSIVELESDMLNGQKLQGPETAAEVRTQKTICLPSSDLGELHVGKQRTGERLSSIYCCP